jgi:flagellar protein FliS
MNRTTHDQYLEEEVTSADPVKLVRMLYRAAIEATVSAREHLRNGRIRERSRAISKALAIVHELLRSLDREHGGEVAESLAKLYGYISERLIEANARQSDPPLAEVERLLTTLLEGWSSISAETNAGTLGEPISDISEYENAYMPLSASF